MLITPDKAAGRSLGWADYLSFPRGTWGTCPDDDTLLPRNTRAFNRTSFGDDDFFGIAVDDEADGFFGGDATLVAVEELVLADFAGPR